MIAWFAISTLCVFSAIWTWAKYGWRMPMPPFMLILGAVCVMKGIQYQRDMDAIDSRIARLKSQHLLDP